MSDNITIRPYQEGDEEEIVQLLELAFDGWPNFDLECSSKDHWEWKHRGLSNSIITLAQSNEKIVGCKHALIFRIQSGNRSIQCYQGTDLAVHPDYRGRRIAHRITEENDRSIKNAGTIFEIGFTMNRKLIKHTKHFPRITQIYTRIKDIDQFLKDSGSEGDSLKKFGFYLSKIESKLRSTSFKIKKRTKQESRKMEAEELLKFDERINDFWKEIKGQCSFATERRKKYLNWRYCDPRGGTYYKEVVEENGKILGYIVLRIKERKKNAHSSIGYIIDLIAQPNQLEVVDSLLLDAIEYFDERKVNLIQSLVVRNHPYEELFDKHNFVNTRTRIYPFYDILNDDINLEKTMNSPRRVHLHYGDTDWI